MQSGGTSPIIPLADAEIRLYQASLSGISFLGHAKSNSNGHFFIVLDPSSKRHHGIPTVQVIKSDSCNNIWHASFGNDKIVEFIDGDVHHALSF